MGRGQCARLTPACLGLWLTHQLGYTLALARYRRQRLAAR